MDRTYQDGRDVYILIARLEEASDAEKAGKYLIPGPARYTLCSKVPLPEDDGRLYPMTMQPGGPCTYQIRGRDVQDLLLKYKGKLDGIQITQDVQPLYAYPVFWHTHYEELTIHCPTCNHTFWWRELDSDYDDFGDAMSTTICPRCGIWNCVDLHFETIEQFRERTSLG
jgi:hypothetical protein